MAEKDKIVAIGAEAVISCNDKAKTVTKQRQPKSYRVKALDERLRLFRTRREAKAMEAGQQLGIKVPDVLKMDERAATITMQLIEGKKVRDILSSGNYPGICKEIGKAVGMMHRNNIVHGDLTTSNMIIEDSEKVYFIDFGLSVFSQKEEDKAVDLHLFRQALESSHHRIAGKCFAAAIAAYKEANSGWEKVLGRLEKVEERGKYKHK